MQNFSHTIWMGDLENYMDEIFVKRSFESMGESVISVKIIRNKATGQPLGYCFVEFPNAVSARDAMLKLNGKPIPGSSPTRRFKLNHASFGKEHLNVQEYSLFVGELSEDVDDLALYNSFRKYHSCRSAKVVLDNGKSRGYGFVRFTEENDQKRAMVEMQNYCSLGWKPIRVSLATPKRPDGTIGDPIPGQLFAVPTTAEQSMPHIPDPLTAAVAAAVTGNSSAQQEYINAYQQYYQQYYAQQYAQQFTQQYPTSTADSYTTPYTGAYVPAETTSDTPAQYYQDNAPVAMETEAASLVPVEKAVVDEPVDPNDCHCPFNGLTPSSHDVFQELEESRWTFTYEKLDKVLSNCI